MRIPFIFIILIICTSSLAAEDDLPSSKKFSVINEGKIWISDFSVLPASIQKEIQNYKSKKPKDLTPKLTEILSAFELNQKVIAYDLQTFKFIEVKPSRAVLTPAANHGDCSNYPARLLEIEFKGREKESSPAVGLALPDKVTPILSPSPTQKRVIKKYFEQLAKLKSKVKMQGRPIFEEDALGALAFDLLSEERSLEEVTKILVYTDQAVLLFITESLGSYIVAESSGDNIRYQKPITYIPCGS